MLNLDKTKISDVAIDSLSEKPELNWLHVGSTSITDECIQSLLKLKNLKYLNVTFTEITEESFFELYDALGENGCQVVGP